MILNPQTLTKAVYDRIKTDAEGSAVRAVLGAGAGSVIPASKLRAEALPARASCARPFLHGGCMTIRPATAGASPACYP
jgi:hypothetical protein